ncbi:ubiquinol-cytochrome C chaperone family protein [soil metagenome]
MFGRFFRSSSGSDRVAVALYGSLVAQARAPGLYATLGVPDTTTGRFEMVVLHSILAIDRLKRAGAEGKELGQEVFDAFCRDMDQSLRELGFGDQSVPKRMKQLGESFYGRAEAYGRTLGDQAGLAAALGRNVFPDSPDTEKTRPLARYAMAVAEGLTGARDADLLAGRVSFPPVDEFAGAAL